MAQAYQLIQAQTLTSSAASITFTNIPQNYTDLKLLVSTRTLAASIANQDYVKFNGSSTGYNSKVLEGAGSGSPISSSYNDSRATLNNGNNATSNTFSNAEIYIPNYTSSNYKSYMVDAVTENNATTSYAHLKAVLWSNSAAITSIEFTNDSGSNYATGTTIYLYGIGGVRATGGTITADSTYTYHTFTSTGSFTALENIKGAEVLAVAGGGGGGADRAGGGGAGGLLYSAGQTFNAGTSYTALVGSGGTGGASTNNSGTQGSSSQIGTLTAIGGGFGSGGSNGNGGNGGSGGGAGGSQTVNLPLGGSPTSGQGNAGGNGAYQPANNNVGAGGGGGAGAAGTAGTAVAGAGGVGSSTYTTWNAITGTGVLSGDLYYIAGGGGGGANSGQGTGSNGAGGIGGGGAGGTSGAGTAGTANTGGGGGGGSNNGGQKPGAAGGSGLIIIRYPN